MIYGISSATSNFMLQRLLFIYLLLLNDLNLFCFMLYESQIKMPCNEKKSLNHILLPLLKCILCIDFTVLLSQAQTSVEILKNMNIITNNKLH